MDIATQAEVVLRGAGYETWTWSGISPPVTCFENAALIGFIYVFDSADSLLATWETRQQAVLARHAAALRAAGAKAWNVYSIFLAGESTQHRNRAIERIEENFALTRKIARAAIRTSEDLERVLLPLIAVKAKPLLGDTNFEARLRSRVKEIPPEAVTAFLSNITPDEVARILGTSS